MEDKSEEPIFEIKKWNAVALWAWGKEQYNFRYSHRYLCYLQESSSRSLHRMPILPRHK